MEAGTQVLAVGRWSALRAVSGTTGWAPQLILTDSVHFVTAAIAGSPIGSWTGCTALPGQLIEEVAA
jgi:hypothetical protein